MSARIYLTADLGNSALKLLSWERTSHGRARVVESVRLAAELGLADELSTWLADQPRASGAAVSSVGSPAIEAELLRALGGALGLGLVGTPEAGVRNDCRAPQSVGSDRLFAARGAWEYVESAAVVVDAGTALTVDALGRDPMSGVPVFLGGAIAPGPRLLAEALARGGARLCAVEPDPRATALGRDTREALLAGVGIGFVGAARHLVEQVAEAADLGAAPVVLTGGERAFLDAEGTFAARRVLVRPALVHEGLLAAGTEKLFAERWHPSD